MADVCEIYGQVFKNGSVALLARVVGRDSSPILIAGILAARYTTYLLDDQDPDAAVALTGHTNVPVSVSSLLYDSLQRDDLWDVDEIGYNFKHLLDVSAHQAFTIAGRNYGVVFTLTPTSGQIILVRFRLHAI